MLSMNVPTGYSHESQNFVNNNDPIRDIPAHLATNVLYAEHDNDRTAEIRDGKILSTLSVSKEIGRASCRERV